jgi:hypothetical protein
VDKTRTGQLATFARLAAVASFLVLWIVQAAKGGGADHAFFYSIGAALPCVIPALICAAAVRALTKDSVKTWTALWLILSLCIGLRSAHIAWTAGTHSPEKSATARSMETAPHSATQHEPGKSAPWVPPPEQKPWVPPSEADVRKLNEENAQAARQVRRAANTPFSPPITSRYAAAFTDVHTDSSQDRAALAATLASTNEQLPKDLSNDLIWESVVLRGDVVTSSLRTRLSRSELNVEQLQSEMARQFAKTECGSEHSYLRRGYAMRFNVRDGANMDLFELTLTPSDLPSCNTP